MDYFLGIDLGSTTTKAVLLDGEARQVGLGLTNTRSSYDVAAAVAKAEALADAELSLIERRLAAGPAVSHLGDRLRRAWRVEVSSDRTEALRRRCVQLAAAGRNGAQVAECVDELFGILATESEALYGPLADDRSRFFRDVVVARFQAGAEAMALDHKVSFEDAMAAFERALVELENSETAPDLTTTIQLAVGRARLSPSEEKIVSAAVAEATATPIQITGMVGTGYGRQRLPFPKDQIRSEILCHGLGAHAMFPNTRTVLDIGGQDTKAIQVDEKGVVTSFQMNDRCAAGCGRYLGYIAEEMNLGIHELGPLALTATRAVRISSTCTVFAGVELRERLSLGERRENILLGLHHAIVLRAMGLLARSGGVRDELTFTGGVARNSAVVQELNSLVGKHYGQRQLNIHSDSIYTGALGAALFAQRKGTA